MQIRWPHTLRLRHFLSVPSTLYCPILLLILLIRSSHRPVICEARQGNWFLLENYNEISKQEKSAELVKWASKHYRLALKRCCESTTGIAFERALSWT
ncbi:hypothetical protein J6590_093726 [Homalodisca vitripennis]|nr:hypothetical protein J6590_093726 [Homalodisca vitripennis]